ncbi:aminopeptidase N, partial [Biomphalaria pfeifferi]
MPSSKIESSDRSYESTNMSVEPKGFHVSPKVGFLFVMVAALITVGVGIIVHFAGGSREDEVLQQCMQLASTGNMEI